MAVTDYKSAGTAANIDRGGPTATWVNPDNAKTSNNSYAVASINKDDESDYLRLTNFSMGVPAGATIDGIEVQIERKGESNAIYDFEIYLRKTTTGQVGDNYASATNWPASDDTEVYGGAADKWGTTWSAADVNHADFGIDIIAWNDNIDSLTDASVDHVQIRVHYTAAGPSGTNTQINIGDAWKSIAAMQINIGDTWKAVAGAQVNIGDDWKTIF